ncbi:MAG TPA: hypothetical protein VNE71_06305 [Myxococcota bacterium]|nr:hypothetical protein [Myxococcota bacterium]
MGEETRLLGRSGRSGGVAPRDRERAHAVERAAPHAHEEPAAHAPAAHIERPGLVPALEQHVVQ